MLSSKRQEGGVAEAKADSDSVGSVASIMEMNGLKYRIPQSLSSGVARSYKREYSQKNEYRANQVITFDWNTGVSYVDPDTAMLSFDFNLTQAALVGFARKYHWSGSLGGAALFSEIRIISKNGVEIDRISDAAQLAKILVDYTVDKDGKAMLQMAQGYGRDPPEVAASPATSFATALNCVIPMKYLSGFFRPTVKDMLIPAGLSSGLRVEISVISDISEALIQLNGDVVPSSFTITDPVMLLQTTELNDPTSAALMAESASNGLEYTFSSFYSTKLNASMNASFTTQINKAVSQGLRLFVALQAPREALALDEIKVDSYASLPVSAYAQYQFRVGQSYFPNVQVTRDTEKFSLAQAAMGGLRKLNWAPNVVDFDEYENGWDNTTEITYGGLVGQGGKALVATSLETNARLNLSGLMLNNSSVAELRMTVGGADVRGVLYLEFVSVAKTSLNRTQLRI